MTAVATERIVTLAGEWGRRLTGAEAEGIGSFLSLLLQWNAHLNLTGARCIEDLVEEHLPDSFALASLVPAGARVVDVGAGGGLPGVPFALLRPDCPITLVEPRAKRTAFLAAARRLIGGTIEVVRGRDEDLPGGGFDVAASRATFDPPTWLGLAGRLLRDGGWVVVFSVLPLDGYEAQYELRDAVSYRTRRGAARWAGAFVPRGTVQAG